MSDTVQVRVGDRERKVVDDQLMAAVADGVLTLAEYDERAGALWQAKVRSDLDALVADLPAAEVEPVRPAPAPPGPEGAPSSRWVVAVMSEDDLRAPLAPGQGVNGVALMGKAVMDLHQHDLPSGVRVRANAVMGEVEVVVPPGSRVHLTGLSLMGERKVQVQPGSGPVVHVQALALMGSVRAREGRGEALAGLASAELAPRSSSVPLPRSGHDVSKRRGGRLRRLRKAVGGSALSVALIVGAAGVVASGTDGRAVFGSDTARISAEEVRNGDTSAAVSVLFGSVTVVVDDDVRVDKGGLVVFGSVDCELACEPATDSQVTVDLRALGGFGSVEILSQGEYDAAQQADEAEDREERMQDTSEDE